MKRTRETIGCFVRKTAKSLVPASAFDQEPLVDHPPDTVLKLVALTRRSVPQHRTYRKALSLVSSRDDRCATPEHLHEAPKMACGRATVVHEPTTAKPIVILDSRTSTR